MCVFYGINKVVYIRHDMRYCISYYVRCYECDYMDIFLQYIICWGKC